MSSLVYLLVWSGALHLIFHIPFTQSVSSFRNTCPYHWYYSNLFCCSINIISFIPSLSLNSLLGSFTLTLHIHLTILISARWSATSFSRPEIKRGTNSRNFVKSRKEYPLRSVYITNFGKNSVKISVLGSYTLMVALVGVKFGTLRAKFHPTRNRPLSNLYTGALRCAQCGS